MIFMSNTVKNTSEESRQRDAETRYDVPKGVDKVLWNVLLEAKSALLVAQGRADTPTRYAFIAPAVEHIEQTLIRIRHISMETK